MSDDRRLLEVKIAFSAAMSSHCYRYNNIILNIHITRAVHRYYRYIYS